MSEKVQHNLKEIRGAYAEILSAYNATFPLDPPTKKDADMMDRFAEDTTDKSDKGNHDLPRILRAKAKKALPMLKEGADQSGNAVSWHRGQPLDDLNQGLKDRIERALKLGI
jgi:hypothetical protein